MLVEIKTMFVLCWESHPHL